MRNKHFVFFLWAVLLVHMLATQATSADTLDAEQNIKASAVVDTFISARKAAGQRSEAGLYLYRLSDDKLVFSHNTSSFDSKKPILVASATKWVSAALILHLIEQNILSVETTVGEYFNKLPKHLSAITVRELISFQSGLTSNERDPCKEMGSLQNCAKMLLQSHLNKQRERGFRYNNVHLHIAAAIAERATKQSWKSLFQRHVSIPLAFEDKVFYTNGRNEKRSLVPNIAAGLYISTRDYLKFLSAIAHDGLVGTQSWLSKRSVSDMLTSKFGPDTKVLFSPFSRYGKLYYSYGYGNWVECDSERFCLTPRNSSAGYYGFYPWIDKHSGYYAVLATRAEAWDFRASVKSAHIVEKLRQPLQDLLRVSR